MSVSFEMFLIDRGVCDGYTIGQWEQYVRKSDVSTFDEICWLAESAVGPSRSVKWLTGLLAHLYPDDWKLWLAYRRLVGEPL